MGLVAVSALAVGLLRTSISMIFDGDKMASIPMVAFIIIGPAVVIVYYSLRAIGRPVHIGTFISSPKKAALATVIAVVFYSIPGAILNEISLIEILKISIVAAILGWIVLVILTRYFEKSTPSGVDDEFPSP